MQAPARRFGIASAKVQHPQYLCASRKARIKRQNVSAGGQGEQGPPPLVGRRLLAEIINRIVALMREHYARGPTTESCHRSLTAART